VEERFSVTFQTDAEVHPDSNTISTGSFPKVKRPRRGADRQLHLALQLKKEESYTSSPPLELRDLFYGEL
jgi:hypothetical protein